VSVFDPALQDLVQKKIFDDFPWVEEKRGAKTAYKRIFMEKGLPET